MHRHRARLGTWLALAGTAVFFAALASFALDASRRDRAALVASFGDERLSRLRIAAREVEAELSEVVQHLELAAHLVDSAEPVTDQRRELAALLAVVPAYQLVAAYDAEGQEAVVALGPRAIANWSRPFFTEELRRAARQALAGGSLQISDVLENSASHWERAFVRPVSGARPARGAVAIVVDQRATFERLRLAAPSPTARLVLLGPHGRSAPLTDPALAAALDAPRGALAAVADRMLAGETGTATLPASEARALGLGDAEAVVAFTSIQAREAGHWSVALLETTASLGAQERAIAARLALLAGLFVLAIFGLSAYLLVSARRAFAVQERLRSAERVAHLREKAEKILENAPVGVLTLDEEGRISGCNRALRERIAPGALGRPVAEAFPQARPEARQALARLLAGARGAAGVQRQLDPPLALTAEGCFAARAVPLDHPSPDLRTLLVLEDVTELRALASQLLRAEKLATVGVLAAGIAHEVGTPLGVVRGRAERLVSRLGPGHPEAPGAQVIVGEIDRISRTIQELLDFSRVSRSSAPGRVTLQGVAAEVVELLAFEARDRKVEVSTEVGDLPPLAADGDQLKQVLVNLTLNAIHACGPGGRVVLRARVDPGRRCARLEVVDDGAGIPEELRHRVFDPFFTTKKRGRGTGLGLTVAAQIVRNHGGELDLDSAVGRGTTAAVTWPLAGEGAEVAHG